MAQDRQQLMESMLSSATGEPEANDPVALLDNAIAQASSYIANPAEVTPETLQELVAMLQQVKMALGSDA